MTVTFRLKDDHSVTATGNKQDASGIRLRVKRGTTQTHVWYSWISFNEDWEIERDERPDPEMKDPQISTETALAVIRRDGRHTILPEAPGAGRFYFRDDNDQWYYVNHAGTWQGMPSPTTWEVSPNERSNRETQRTEEVFDTGELCESEHGPREAGPQGIVEREPVRFGDRVILEWNYPLADGMHGVHRVYAHIVRDHREGLAIQMRDAGQGAEGRPDEVRQVPRGVGGENQPEERAPLGEVQRTVRPSVHGVIRDRTVNAIHLVRLATAEGLIPIEFNHIEGGVWIQAANFRWKDDIHAIRFRGISRFGSKFYEWDVVNGWRGEVPPQFKE